MDNSRIKILIFLLFFLFLGLGLFFLYNHLSSNTASQKEEEKKVSSIVPENEEVKDSLVEEDDDIISTAPEKKELDLDFLFFGDMMLDRHVGDLIEERGLDHIFGKMDSQGIFYSRDLIGANLEGAVTNEGKHYPPEYLYDFAFSPDIIEEISKDYNFNFFNIANNHLADQGERGIRETEENLNNLGLYFSGCQDGQAGECSLKIIDFDDTEIAFLGFSMVYAIPDQTEMLDLIESAASSSDMVIVNVHWGVEYEHRFNQTQQDFAHFFVDSGADVVIGHHPHVVQGMEVYEGKAIFYSLGNFVFDQYFSTATQEGFALDMNIKEEEIIYSFLPFKSELSRVEMIDKEEDIEEFLQRFVNWSDLGQKVEEEVLTGSFSAKR